MSRPATLNPRPPVLKRRDMLGSFKPVRGTAYFICRTKTCKQRIPYRVTKPNGMFSRVGACPYCGRRRPLTVDEQELLTGNETKDVRTTIPLVYKLASSFADKCGLHFDDVYGEAMEAAMHAAATFDAGNGYRFTTHLVTHVSGRLNRALVARVRGHRHLVLMTDLGSIDEDGNEWFSFENGGPDQLDQSESRDYVRDLIGGDTLAARDRHVIVRHYGLDGRPPETFAAIGAKLGISRERTRQIAWKAIDKIRPRIGVEEAA